jgi:hypothetical protein
MTPERWKQVEELCQSALELEEDRRRAFLDRACADDEALRRDVESLLQFETRGDRSIQEPALEVAAKMIAQEKPGPWSGDSLALTRSFLCWSQFRFRSFSLKDGDLVLKGKNLQLNIGMSSEVHPKRGQERKLDFEHGR